MPVDATLLSELVIAFFLYSFVGWAFEVVYCSVRERHLINRGFLNGPWCPIYGSGAIAATVLLGHVSDIGLLFVSSAVVCCAIEYGTSWTMERLFHTRWWDYSERHFNLHGRICLAGALLFGLGCTVVVTVANPLLVHVCSLVDERALWLVAGLLLAVFAVDVVVTNLGMRAFRDKVDEFCDEVTASLESALEEARTRENPLDDTPVSEALDTAQEKLGALADRGREASDKLPYDVGETLAGFIGRMTNQERRVLRAFPRVRASRSPKDLKRMPAKMRDELLRRSRRRK